jgi:hypothetical protein
MKRNMIIAAVAVAGIATYLFRRNKSMSNNETNGTSSPRSHHLVDSFSRAKQHANSMG